MSIKICCICEYEDAKYKCPKCRMFYCSVACCSKHKENCAGVVKSKTNEINESPNEESNSEYNFPSEDTVPKQKLEQLRYSEEVKQCLRNPQVRDIITSVLKEKNPTKAVAAAMTESVFVELADACLKVVEPSDEDKPC